MNDLQRRLNAFFDAPRSDFAQFSERLESSVIQLTAKNDSKSQVLRPIRPEDEPAMRRFHTLFSEKSVYERYFKHFILEGRIDHRRLFQICTNSSDFFVLVVEHHKGHRQPAEILAVGHLTNMDESNIEAFALLMRDDASDHGFDLIMRRRLIVLARTSGLKLLVDDNPISNQDLLNFCKKLGFSLHTIPDKGIVRVCLSL